MTPFSDCACIPQNSGKASGLQQSAPGPLQSGGAALPGCNSPPAGPLQSGAGPPRLQQSTPWIVAICGAPTIPWNGRGRNETDLLVEGEGQAVTIYEFCKKIFCFIVTLIIASGQPSGTLLEPCGTHVFSTLLRERRCFANVGFEKCYMGSEADGGLGHKIPNHAVTQKTHTLKKHVTLEKPGNSM